MGGGLVFWMILLGGWVLLSIPFGFLVAAWMCYCDKADKAERALTLSRPPYCIRCGRTHWDGECQR